jgi:uncharacterized protein YjcR
MDRFDQAKEMRDAGMKLREIGEVLGVSKSRAGVPRGRSGAGV